MSKILLDHHQASINNAMNQLNLKSKVQKEVDDLLIRIESLEDKTQTFATKAELTSLAKTLRDEIQQGKNVNLAKYEDEYKKLLKQQIALEKKQILLEQNQNELLVFQNQLKTDVNKLQTQFDTQDKMDIDDKFDNIIMKTLVKNFEPFNIKSSNGGQIITPFIRKSKPKTYLFSYKEEKHFAKYKLSIDLQIPKFRESLQSGTFQKKYVEDIDDIFNMIYPLIQDKNQEDFTNYIKLLLLMDIYFEPYVLFGVVSRAIGTEPFVGDIHGKGIKILMRWFEKNIKYSGKSVNSNIVENLVKGLVGKYKSTLGFEINEDNYKLNYNNEMHSLEDWIKNFTEKIGLVSDTKYTFRSNFTQRDVFISVSNLTTQWIKDVLGIVEIRNFEDIRRGTKKFYDWYKPNEEKTKNEDLQDRIIADILIRRTYDLDTAKSVNNKHDTIKEFDLYESYERAKTYMNSSKSSESEHYVNYLSFWNRANVHYKFFSLVSTYKGIKFQDVSTIIVDGLRCMTLLAFVSPEFYNYVNTLIEDIDNLPIQDQDKLYLTAQFLVGFIHIHPVNPKSTLNTFGNYNLIKQISLKIVPWILQSNFPMNGIVGWLSQPEIVIGKEVKYIPIIEFNVPISIYLEDQLNENKKIEELLVNLNKTYPKVVPYLLEQYNFKKPKNSIQLGSKSTTYEIIASNINEMFQVTQLLRYSVEYTIKSTKRFLSDLYPWIKPISDQVLHDILTIHSLDKSLPNRTMEELSKDLATLLNDIKKLNRIEPNIKLTDTKKSDFEGNTIELFALTWIVDYQKDVFKQANYNPPNSVRDLKGQIEMTKVVEDILRKSGFPLNKQYILEPVNFNNSTNQESPFEYGKFTRIYSSIWYIVSYLKSRFTYLNDLWITIKQNFPELIGIRNINNKASNLIAKMDSMITFLSNYILKSEVWIYADIYKDSQRFQFNDEKVMKSMNSITAFLPLITTQSYTKQGSIFPKYLEKSFGERASEYERKKLNQNIV